MEIYQVCILVSPLNSFMTVGRVNFSVLSFHTFKNEHTSIYIRGL